MLVLQEMGVGPYLEELRRDLDQKHVRAPRQYGPKGHYIEAWHAQAEANRILARFLMKLPEGIRRAIAEGRACAAAVDGWLTGSTHLPAPVSAHARPLR